ncbi:MAG: hypothetical protein AABO41_17070 [Acidobacteriota bacterium]
MISTAVKHETQWVTASPIWGTAAADPVLMQRPAVLRFDSDSFMQDVAQLLESSPVRLSEFIAKPESFQARPTGKGKDWKPKPPPHLKLYQPAHGHFYLASASLVCRLPGLPDRVVNTASNEKVSLVLRRIGPGNREMAWVTDSANAKKWQPLNPDEAGEFKALAPAEELLPMFPINFIENSRRRRLFVGLIPTSSRESFQAAPALGLFPEPEIDPKTKQPLDPRMQEIEARVIDRLKQLNELKPDKKVPAPSEEEKESYLFMLLDLADFISTNASATWQSIYSGAAPAQSNPGRLLYDVLARANVQAAGSPTWQSALRAVWDQQDRITGESAQASTLSYDLKKTNLKAADLRAGLQSALGKYDASKTPQPPVLVPKFDPAAETLYVLRCVYQRPSCLFESDIVSSASERFAIATFFDTDAPSRPVRITLPIDTSIAGLRKFPKNVAFLTSDKLRKQMAGVADLKKAIDGDLSPSPDFQLGEICSFSIPIITLCAFIVLFIFLILLNIAFFWLPFIKICLPIPLKAKK